MNELALFAGAGGGILAGRLLGWTTVCACEIEPYPRRVLLHNQEVGLLPRFPIWDDIRTFDGNPWRGLVDVVSGGFPCQDISAAGKGAGITGTRSGLWSEMHRIIREVQPRYAFMENSPMLTSRGLGRVLGDLAEIGYHAAWCVLGAADCGAPHRRDRIWILAHDADTDCLQRPEQGQQHARTEIPAGSSADRLEPRGDMEDSTSIGLETHGVQQRSSCPPQSERAAAEFGGAGPHYLPHAHRARCAQTPQKRSDSQAGRAEPGGIGHVPHADLPGCEQQRWQSPDRTQHPTAQRSSWWSFEPRVGRVAHGVASRVDRLKALGNGQVPLVAATAFKILKHRLENTRSST